MSVGAYLRQCRTRLTAIETKNISRNLTLVLGNESADLDSCVSSIAYSYLQTVKGNSQELLVPVLNIPRADVSLRAELLLLLKSTEMSESDLICRDELSADLQQNASKISFVLVDHNHFKVEGFSAKDVHVSAIVDHHVDEGLYPDADPRIIETSGSCSSLVVGLFKDLWGTAQLSEAEAQLTKLALSAILVDTSNLTNQATDTDRDIVKFLRSRVMQVQGWSEGDQIEALQKAKRDITGLSVSQLLRRDYKEWDLGANAGLWGVSSVTTSLKKLSQMPNWLQDASVHAQDRKLDVHMIMTKHGDKELFIHVVNSRVSEYVLRFIEKATTEMRLTPWRTGEYAGPKFYAYQQGDLTATRKKVATIVQSIK